MIRVMDRETAPIVAEGTIEVHEPLVFERGRLVRILIGTIALLLGPIFVFIGIGAMIQGFDGPIVAPLVFAGGGLAAIAVGVTFLFGRKRLVVDPGVRLVTIDDRLLGHHRRTTLPFDSFGMVGIGRCDGNGDYSRQSYFVVLRGMTDVPLPLTSGRLEEAVEHAERVARMMDLAVDASPQSSLAGLIRLARGN